MLDRDMPMPPATEDLVAIARAYLTYVARLREERAEG